MLFFKSYYSKQKSKNILFQKDSKLSKKLFSNYPSASYPNRIGTELYAPHLLKELMWDLYINSPIKEKDKTKNIFKPLKINFG